MAHIVVAADHAGFKLKQVVVAHLERSGHQVTDLGTHSEEPVDYPPICAVAGRMVATGEADVGIVLGGSGQGETLVANKVRGVRAALCLNEYSTRLARSHNDANVLGLGGRVLGDGLALAIVDLFLATPFDGGRHQRRVGQIAEIEAQETARS